MSLKIGCEDVRSRLNGTVSGSTYWFWDNSIESGSLYDVISGSSIYLRYVLGDSIYDTTDTNTSRTVRELELVYSCFKLLVQSSGGVIVDGFDWKAGVSVSTPRMLEAYGGLINGFKESAWNIFKTLHTFVISEDWQAPNWDKTAASPY